ncbi:hypothetical protein BGW41_005637 [Actinomortierella wolfii]|nr:hypothetical protein BGW41_005637 [Actinomortierella wolfii]
MAEEELAVSTPTSEVSDAATVVGTTVTDDMIKEEERLQEAADKEEQENIKKLKAKAADEYNSTVNKQRYQRLHFLIEKSTLYSNFLAQKLERQQKEARAKAEAMEAKRAAAAAKEAEEKKKEAEQQNGSNDAKDADKQASSTATHVATRSSSRLNASKPEVDASATKKKASTSVPSKKRKVDDSDYQLADYMDQDTIKKARKGEAVAPIKEKEIKKEAPVTKPTISARQPSLVTGGALRDYQLAGVEWMVSLYENGLNGILADEMGLGKTLQTISFLAYLREKGVWGPFLIVAPMTTLANWVSEFERFTPSVPVVLYHGTPEQRTHIRNKKFRRLDPSFPICVTSYEMVMNDRKHLQKYQWKYIVVDEGHRLKNLNCKLIRELKTYHSANRLLLTGTPLQNNLSELWSLLNFLLPDIFDDLEIFQEWFDFSDLNAKEGQDRILGEESQNGIVSSLHWILKPFLLRRVKTDVEHSLPKKKEYIVYAPMTPIQKEWYEAVLSRDIRHFLISKKMGESEAQHDKGTDSSESTDVESLKGTGSETTTLVQDDAEDAEIDLTGSVDGEDEEQKSTDEAVEAKAPRRTNRTTTMPKSYTEKSDRAFFKDLENNEPTTSPEMSALEKLKAARAVDLRKATKAVVNMRLSNIVMQLRKVCNHPFLFDWPIDPKTRMPVLDDNLLSASGKMLVLNRLLPALFERGHKVLIFSQFTTMLDIIQDWAELHMQYRCCRIDGTVSQESRRQQIVEFNTSPDLKLFLLSTRAGGLGINLTSADTVIIFDSDWNPQMDLQAQDRVHRIGQTKPVVIYRLVTANSVENKIIERAAMKRKLEKLVIHKGKFKAPPTTSETMNSSGRKATLAIAELAEMLAQDDGEKFMVATKDDVVISDKHLEKLLDRSEAAFAASEQEDEARANDGATDGGALVFKTVEQTKDDRNDILKVGNM